MAIDLRSVAVESPGPENISQADRKSDTLLVPLIKNNWDHAQKDFFIAFVSIMLA
jgi:hypothetical protein